MALLKYLFAVEGRIDRRGYAGLVLTWLILIAILQTLIIGLPDFATSGRLMDMMWDGDLAWAQAVDRAVQENAVWWPRYVAFGLLLVVGFASFLAVSARRLHDIGRPGGFALISFLPFVGPQAVFWVLLLLPGDETENRFGPARLQRPRQGEAKGRLTDPI